MKKEAQRRVNEKITAYKVRLIDVDGNNVGEVNRSFAIQKAKEVGLDLVEMTSGFIPVCKIIDWGKVQYQESKSKPKHTDNAAKEVRIFYNIGEADLQRKINQIGDFLKDNHKVIVTLETKKKGKTFGRTVGLDVAKQKLFDIVQKFNPEVKMSDLNPSGKSCTYTLMP